MRTLSARLFATSGLVLRAVGLSFPALMVYAGAPSCWATTIGELRLEGEVVQSSLAKEEAKNQIWILKVNLRFTNSGNRPVIILRGTYGEHQQWWVLDTFLYRSQEDSREGRFFSSQPLGPANSRSLQRWQDIRKTLQTSAPPREWTHVIEPQKTVVFEADIFIVIKESDSIPPKSRIWFKLALEMWPLNIEPAESSTQVKPLGISLQKKWQPFGDLWLENILSAPISFTLPE